ncbi:MAG: UDP-N-acetylmuramoyl-L-alanyl-D-glutamate--2,6-diaminopimelate ligase [Bacteroidia bacterium]|nr:UDP-N-acetylmuramoyl-L-alanyl-D-glutamate--2,6-diaminopimelate ligase [Bacteroidia bacterium]
MKKLSELTGNVRIVELIGDPEVQISGLTINSREVAPGMIFAAIRGTHTDGHRYIAQAIEKGAAAILCEQSPSIDTGSTTIIRVENTSRSIGQLASAYYDHPSQLLKVVGVTGTNGKTTIATLLYKLFENLGFPSGLISTIRVCVHLDSTDATHTTPDAITFQRHLAEMVKAGCLYVFVEISSHAMDQHRVEGVRFAGGIFTNLTRDHLDYHLDFQAYLKAKKLFFDQLDSQAFAIVNSEDRNGMVMLQNCLARKYSYTTRGSADFEGRMIEQHTDGMLVSFNSQEVWIRFIGTYNVSNLLAVYSAAILLGQEKSEILTRLSQLEPVEGRLETILLGNDRIGIVDYAHTPDALENVLTTLGELKTRDIKIITVFGAGGDRDRGKRPLMADVACRLSDRVIITSDNPRTEDPELILDDIRKGVPAGAAYKVLSIINRHEAIKTAVALAGKGDIVLLAGKGHETYQEINGVKHHFDDREELGRLSTETRDAKRVTRDANPDTRNLKPDTL